MVTLLMSKDMKNMNELIEKLSIFTENYTENDFSK